MILYHGSYTEISVIDLKNQNLTKILAKHFILQNITNRRKFGRTVWVESTKKRV